MLPQKLRFSIDVSYATFCVDKDYLCIKQPTIIAIRSQRGHDIRSSVVELLGEHR